MTTVSAAVPMVITPGVLPLTIFVTPTTLGAAEGAGSTRVAAPRGGPPAVVATTAVIILIMTTVAAGLAVVATTTMA